MTEHRKIHKRRLGRFITRVERDEGGIAAVEFAMIAPLMIFIFYAVVEMTDAMLIDRKVTQIASTTADLVAQVEVIDNTEIDNIFDAATAILSPYTATTAQIIVTSVVADGNNNTTVGWSDSLNGNAYAVGAPYQLPQTLTQPNGSVIVAEVTYVFTPAYSEIFEGLVTFRDTFYMKPRRSIQVARVP